ncbi:LysR family transcriptional regulator [Paraburkholderia elongata]|uniref:LysR family transcriptional regulator n=1 Tax=Paraburkholderia elongata TaxID=2675747 RepID=A0A972NP42_9BURK|nr:LysR family transcriptional regulator [Paraburkholderia elongata]NPT55322.1 LysR family transcriptional regulator [Paraburkholderia elongata]
MKLELRHIRCFIAVARHLHFARAADELGIAPPSLTKQIQEAEKLLQVRLFHRTKRSVSLTAAGEAYLPEATAALSSLERGRELAELAERGELGRIQIGYVASAAFAGIMQTTIKGFREYRPKVDVVLTETPMDRVPTMLVDGQLDVAYVRPPMSYPEGIHVVGLYRDEFVLAIPEDSLLADHPAIAPHQLRDACFALPEQDFGTLEVARRGRFRPKLGPRPGPLAAVLACVSLGDMIAVVPRTLCDCVTLPGVIYRPLVGKPIVSEVALAFRRHERAHAVREFLKYVGVLRV